MNRKKTVNKPFVAILMGSDSDLPTMQETLIILEKFEIKTEVRVTSAHRTPEATHEYVKDADKRGCGVFIAAAGLAAHLAGTVAGLTVKPVIGVPMEAGPLDGLDALLSTVQMPGGIPVAAMAIGKAGARNAAYLAAQILARQDSGLERKLMKDRRDSARAILKKNENLHNKLKQ